MGDRMKIIKNYSKLSILIFKGQNIIEISVGKLIFKKSKISKIKDSIILVFLETSIVLEINVKTGCHCWEKLPFRIVDSIRYEDTLFVIDELFWGYVLDLSDKRITYLCNMQDIGIYELAYITIEKDNLFAFDNYTSIIICINMNSGKYKYNQLFYQKGENKYYIDGVEQIIFQSNTILLLDQKSHVIATVEKKTLRVLLWNGKWCTLKYPRGIAFYKNLLVICNTYRNRLDVYDGEKYLIVNSNIRIGKPRWVDFFDDKIVICDGKRQSLLIGNMQDELQMRIEKELEGFQDIHCCIHISETKLVVIDADDTRLIILDRINEKRIFVDLRLNDPHCVDIDSKGKMLFIADSGNSRIVLYDMSNKKSTNIDCVKVNERLMPLYMPRAVKAVCMNVIIFTLGYGGVIVFFDIILLKTLFSLRINGYVNEIDKARAIKIDSERKEIFLSATECGKILVIIFEEKIDVQNFNALKVREVKLI